MAPNPADPPDITSVEFWMGPSAASFFASAAEFEALAAAIIGMLGGQAAVRAAMEFAWPDPTGAAAVLANVPHMLWMATAAGLLQGAAAMITATGQGFEMARMATPTPAEVAYNQGEHVALNNANFLGFLTPYIVANRNLYASYWVRGVSNKVSYEAASVAGVQAIPPLPPPPPTASPMSGSGSGLGQGAGTDALSGAGSPMEMMMSVLPMVMQMPASLGQSLGGGGPLQSLGQVPQQIFGQLSSLASQVGEVDGANLGDSAALSSAGWTTATPQAGGPVSASLTGGGTAGVASAGAALRSPASWSSTVNASAGGQPAAAVSRIAEARGGATTPASMAGMGSGGAMMAPLAHGAAAGQGSQQRQDSETQPSGAAVLVSAAAAFRSPDGLPTISGSSGTQFGGAEQERH